MKHFLIILMLCCIRDSALTTIAPTTLPTELGCYEELQRGEYPEDLIIPNNQRAAFKIKIHCTNSYDNYVYRLLLDYFTNPEDNPFFSVAYHLVSNYTLWEDFCQEDQKVIDCINSQQSHCSDSFGPWYFREGEPYIVGLTLLDFLGAFHTRTCTGANVKDSLQSILNEKPDRNCIDLDAIVDNCLHANILREFFLNNDPYFYYRPSQKNSLTRLSTAILRCALDSLAKSSCSETQKELHYQATKILLPFTVDVDELDPNSTEGIDYSQLLRCTAGVYGDPHIKLCGADSLITCSSPGTQIYYSGPLLEIVGVNTRVGTTEATTLTNIDIRFYSESKSWVGRYQAGDSRLPSTLVGGQSSAGPSHGEVKVVTVKANYRVDLVYDPLGLIIKLRRWGANYFFTMRAAEVLFSAGSGLLVTGCPTSERLDVARENRVRRGIPDVNCENACDPVSQTEFYDACFFDCKTMRSLEAAQMTTQASEMEDEIKLNDTELRRTAIIIKDDDISLSSDTSVRTTTFSSTARTSSTIGLTSGTRVRTTTVSSTARTSSTISLSSATSVRRKISSSTPRTTNTASKIGISLLGAIYTLIVYIYTAVQG